jgi:SAM-dependent methyltransferase
VDRDIAPKPPAQGEVARAPAYPGTENLEAMAAARRYNRFLVRLVIDHAAGARRVLDFGAGIGTFAAALRAHGIEPVCFEPDAAQAARLEAQGFAVERRADDIADGAFDAIYTFNVLEHIEDDAAALGRLFAWLRPGGRLLVYVPAFARLFGPMDRKVGHLRRYSRGQLAARVAGAGFDIERIVYVDCLGFAAALAHRAVGNASGTLDPRAVRLYDRCVFPASRALDPVFGRWFGKNLLVSAVRPV